MTPAEFSALTAELAPHVVDVSLCAARLLPVAFLCPLLGGATTPTPVKLSLVLALSGFLHVSAGVSLHNPTVSLVTFGALIFKEFLFGTAIGLTAALPFDAARIGGRFIDTFRGSSAEASLPYGGSKESALGDGLYQLLVAGAASGPAFPLVVGAIVHSYAWVPAGTASITDSLALHVVALAGTAMSVGLAIGAPIAGIALAIDATAGLISRAAPQLNLQEFGTPVKILAGGAIAWFALGVMLERLMNGVLHVDGAARIAATLVRS